MLRGVDKREQSARLHQSLQARRGVRSPALAALEAEGVEAGLEQRSVENCCKI
jgi:hypothetical protein